MPIIVDEHNIFGNEIRNRVLEKIEEIKESDHYSEEEKQEAEAWMLDALVIMVDAFAENRGTELYLSHLDLVQLEYAINKAQELIADIKSSGKVEIWRVSSWITAKFFKEHDDALDFFLSEAKKAKESKSKNFDLKIDTVEVYEAELDEYLKG